MARVVAIAAGSMVAIGVFAVAASAHGGDITIEASGAVSGATVTYSVHMIWEDGHDVLGQGVVINATGPGGSRSATLPATNSSGRTSGSITLGDGTWTVTFSTDGGSRTISQKIGEDPVTSPPPTPSPTAAPAPAPTAAPAPIAPPTTRRAGATTTTRPGATTTTLGSPDTTTTTVAAVVETTVAPDASTSSTSSTTSSTTTSIAVTEIASSSADDDGGGSGGLIAGIVVVALVFAGVGAAFWRRRVSSATGLPSADAPGE